MIDPRETEALGFDDLLKQTTDALAHTNHEPLEIRSFLKSRRHGLLPRVMMIE
jgi:hypothetical protein